ncbi:MAG: hypothetical protein P4L86_01265 [Mycobacterium sp.]|nr:hypothetical protein [Mycobacterium sp.]
MAGPQIGLGRPLTTAQIARVRDVARRRLRAGLSTRRCDRPRAEAAVIAAYRAAGLDEPAVMVWMDSPLGGRLTAEVIKSAAMALPLRDNVWALLGFKSPWDRVVDRLGPSLAEQLWSNLTNQIVNELHERLAYQLGEPLECQLREQLATPFPDDVRNQVIDRLGRQLSDGLKESFGGQLVISEVGDERWEELSLWRDCAWLVSTACASELAGSIMPELDAVCAACLEVDWWWPMQGAVVLTDRPTVISRDSRGRLHSEYAPALSYADGFRVYARHGKRVPADLEDPR